MKKDGLKLNIQKTKNTASSPLISWQIGAETMKPVADFIFLGPKSLQMVTAAMKLKDICSLNNLDSILKNRDITLPTSQYSQSYGFSSGHVWMWELDHM